MSPALTKKDFEKKLAKQRLAQQRQIAKRLEKQQERLNDSAYIEEQKAKQHAAKMRQVQRQQEKLKEKLQDPDYLIQQKLKRQKALEKQKLKKKSTFKSKPASKEFQLKVVPIKKATKPIASKGLKGRSRTAEEKRLEKKLADIGCICCLNKGWYSSAMREDEGQHFISMHHVQGRTQPWAHAKQLPLCQFHHQIPPPAEAPSDLFPLHGSAISVWEKVNGKQQDLLIQVYAMIDEERPWVIEEELASSLLLRHGHPMNE